MNRKKLALLGIMLSQLNSTFCREHPWSLPELAHYLKISEEKALLIYNFINKEDDKFSNLVDARYYDVLPSLINKFNLKVGVEVGVLYGRHAEKILSQTHIEKLYCIDAYSSKHLIWPQQTCDALFLKVGKLLAKWQPRSVFLRELSTDAAKTFNDHSIDFIFIDADHSYEGVKNDLEVWYSKVRPGGILSGDDYDNFPGVTRAVDEFFQQVKLPIKTERQRRFWWVQKPL